jgi:hypothetical protein
VFPFAGNPQRAHPVRGVTLLTKCGDLSQIDATFKTPGGNWGVAHPIPDSCATKLDGIKVLHRCLQRKGTEQAVGVSMSISGCRALLAQRPRRRVDAEREEPDS